MSSILQFRVKAGGRLFVNGAVMRFDRKVAVEFLNDVSFLLENHVLQAEDADTPLRQLYFIVQLMLIEPENRDRHADMLHRAFTDILSAFRNPVVLDGLRAVHHEVVGHHYFEALKLLRRLFAVEAEILKTERLPLAVQLAPNEQEEHSSWRRIR